MQLSLRGGDGGKYIHLCVQKQIERKLTIVDDENIMIFFILELLTRELLNK